MHLTNGEHYAGIEKILDLLAQFLPNCGFEVCFACLKPDRFPMIRQAQQAPLYKLPMQNKWDLRPAKALAKLTRRHGYSLINTHTARSALIGRIASLWAGVPMVHHFHSPATVDTPNQLQNQVNVLVERCCLIGVTEAITVSEDLRDYAHWLGVPRSRISVVLNGVPIQDRLIERRVPQSTWTLGTVALFRPRKGVEVLLDAIALLKQKGFSLKLRAVGNFETSDYEAEVKARVVSLGLEDDIDWRGFQKDVNAELCQMDLFVLPSLFGEGMPMVILESMALGLPVIATQIEGISEVICDGVNGLITEPGNPDSLAIKIAQVISGEVDWYTMRSNARQRQFDCFSARRMAEEVAEVYRKVLI
ncbi:glycosyltransferase [Pleurocapsa sp. PCC 7319]|uniref:glycosyltransferase n=1 Tax=Pleurocapsa sp. PCC 7319 TaxID=118161 RepID=UPI00192C1C84|nr:glycosyltransferase [Pleurocapsa sp. PCC 7319]